jgi:multicomponent Na+:H+ antiporter subunit G
VTAWAAAFAFLAALGLLRLPDLYTRMQAATKAGSLGAGLILLATALHFGTLGTTARALLVAFFVFLTAPVAAHAIGRAAYTIGVPLWKGTRLDERRQATSVVKEERDGGAPEQGAGR